MARPDRLLVGLLKRHDSGLEPRLPSLALAKRQLRAPHPLLGSTEVGGVGELHLVTRAASFSQLRLRLLELRVQVGCNLRGLCERSMAVALGTVGCGSGLVLLAREASDLSLGRSAGLVLLAREASDLSLGRRRCRGVLLQRPSHHLQRLGHRLFPRGEFLQGCRMAVVLFEELAAQFPKLLQLDFKSPNCLCPVFFCVFGGAHHHRCGGTPTRPDSATHRVCAQACRLREPWQQRFGSFDSVNSARRSLRHSQEQHPAIAPRPTRELNPQRCLGPAPQESAEGAWGARVLEGNAIGKPLPCGTASMHAVCRDG
mmetsp:Transcript_1904/g.7490  ORF Transcript_1904/g.7490 Transcript_1904/m.7490 type:complete len:314 (+) Transcript_1904:1003-1944(+)